jgi:hypothetical protein
MNTDKLTDKELGKQFRDWYMLKTEHDTEYFKTLYMDEPEGCVPEVCLGDDLAMDIIDKVHHPHRFVGDVLIDEFGPMREACYTDNNTGELAILPDWIAVVTQPDYMDGTMVVMYLYNRMELLYHNCFKMWHYYFPTMEELGKELREIYESCKKVLASLKAV